MAERGAHLTQTALSKPSIFEVVAQQSLSNTIQPALQKIIEFLGSLNPERYGWLEKWFDELYLSLNFLLQNHYLSHHDGSFSEIFYGLCRVSVHFGKEGELKRRGQLLSLLQLVFLPYVWQKIEKIVQKLQDDYAYGTSSRRTRKQLMSYFILKSYKFGSMAWEFAILYYYLAYLAGKSKSHSPLFSLFGLALQYAEAEDEMTTTWEAVSNKNRWFSPKNLGQGFLRFLEVGAFGLQFLQWWQAEQHTTNMTDLPVPPPPTQDKEELHLKRLCPICRKSWRIETLLPVSGFVFCFRCIMQYVQEHRACPVTGYPASTKDLVRLYK
ncbi:hypothetical protein R5R35_009191 [Gryllus longicercus]|uniref:Peroxisome assembly protein 12 n=1 Tax=Gryllus longicercus TaxID=2509291 RepID=A0AAN9YZ43_9ORTH